MNNKSLIFTSGEATSKNISVLVFKSEIKNDFSLKKSNFLFLVLLKNWNNLVYSNASAFRTETQLFP